MLGVSRRGPTPEALRELVAAHLTRVPFENISKLYNRKHHDLADLPPLQLYLDGIERYHFGGTCYSNNFHFYSLLASLRYDVKLCAADMRTPDVHAVIMVNVDGREYLVDAGYGAPFLSPLPRDLATEYIVEARTRPLHPQAARCHWPLAFGDVSRWAAQRLFSQTGGQEVDGVSPRDCRIFKPAQLF